MSFTQLPPGAPSAISGPRLLNPTLVPTLRRPRIPIAPWQFAGESTGPPSLPADTTTRAPAAVAWLIALWEAESQLPVPPRLILMTCAGYGFVGAPGTGSPAAQRMPSTTSELN